MDKIVLRKGNLFNQLSNKIDRNLIDSSQYDLEVTVGDDRKYYRVRYLASSLEAFEVTPSSFVTSRNHQFSTSISEVANFKKTDFFWEEFPYKRAFQNEFFKEGNDKNTEAYYSFLQRMVGKKTINKYEPIYQFSLPPIDVREKFGVLSYDLDINLVRNRYYLVFFLEKVASGFYQQEEPQYLIYDKNSFMREKETLEEAVINLAIENEYPLNFLQYVYIVANGNLEIISQFFKTINGVSNYEAFSRYPIYNLVKENVRSNEDFKREIDSYIKGEKQDIDYSYRNKQLIYK